MQVRFTLWFLLAVDAAALKHQYTLMQRQPSTSVTVALCRIFVRQVSTSWPVKLLWSSAITWSRQPYELSTDWHSHCFVNRWLWTLLAILIDKTRAKAHQPAQLKLARSLSTNGGIPRLVVLPRLFLLPVLMSCPTSSCALDTNGNMSNHDWELKCLWRLRPCLIVVLIHDKLSTLSVSRCTLLAAPQNFGRLH